MKRVCRKDGYDCIILVKHGHVYDDSEDSNVHVHHNNDRHEKKRVVVRKVYWPIKILPLLKIITTMAPTIQKRIMI